MRIRLALLALVLAVGVSACGPKAVGIQVDAQAAGARPISLSIGERGELMFEREHFIIAFSIARTGEMTYSVTGAALPRKGEVQIVKGDFYIVLAKNGVVSSVHSLRSRNRRAGAIQLQGAFASPEFDHVLATYDLEVKPGAGR